MITGSRPIFCLKRLLPKLALLESFLSHFISCPLSTKEITFKFILLWKSTPIWPQTLTMRQLPPALRISSVIISKFPLNYFLSSSAVSFYSNDSVPNWINFAYQYVILTPRSPTDSPSSWSGKLNPRQNFVTFPWWECNFQVWIPKWGNNLPLLYSFWIEIQVMEGRTKTNPP